MNYDWGDISRKMVNNIPFDIYESASNLGYLVYEIEFNKLEKFNIENKSIGHFNFVYDDKKIIVINKNINELKKRYFLALEIFSFNEKDEIKIKEDAIELLMPKIHVLSFYNSLSTPFLHLFIDKYHLHIDIIKERLLSLNLRYFQY